MWQSYEKFGFKDKVPNNVRSHLLYRYTCDGCNAIYIGKTRRHYMVRVFEHLGLSMRTHKKFTYNPKNGNNSAILNHVNCQGCVGKEENFKIIGSATTDYHLCLKESLLIQKYKPRINTNENSIPLKLFWFLFFFLIHFYSFTTYHFYFHLDSFFIFLPLYFYELFFLFDKKRKMSHILL